METRRYRIPEHVEFNRVEGDYVLMDMKAGKYFGLDPVASILWQAIADHGCVEPGVEEVLKRFAVGRQRAECDAEELIQRLARDSLVSACSADQEE